MGKTGVLDLRYVLVHTVFIGAALQRAGTGAENMSDGISKEALKRQEWCGMTDSEDFLKEQMAEFKKARAERV